MLAKSARIAGAVSALDAPWASFAGVTFYPSPFEDERLSSPLTSGLRNHPLPDGNKRAALVSMLEHLHREGFPWPYRAHDDELAEVFELLAAGRLTEQRLQTWIAAQYRES